MVLSSEPLKLVRGGVYVKDIELGYLAGLLAGDGYIHHDAKNRHYTVEVYLNSETDTQIQNYLLELLKKLRLNPYIRKDTRYKCNRIRIRNKKFHYFSRSLIDAKTTSLAFKIGFVSGLIDADGEVVPKKHLKVVNTDKKLMLKAKEILEELGLNPKMNVRNYENKNWSPLFTMYVPVDFIRYANSVKAAAYRNSSSGVETPY